MNQKVVYVHLSVIMWQCMFSCFGTKKENKEQMCTSDPSLFQQDLKHTVYSGVPNTVRYSRTEILSFQYHPQYHFHSSTTAPNQWGLKLSRVCT